MWWWSVSSLSPLKVDLLRWDVEVYQPSPHLINAQDHCGLQIAAEVLQTEIDADWMWFAVQDNARGTHQLSHDGCVAVNLHNIRSASLPRTTCGNENCGTTSRQQPGAGICYDLSEAVRSNPDWWQIRKTDCIGWWTAVSLGNLAISDPAELTIASATGLSISDSGGYSAFFTHVSEMSAASSSSQGSAVQAQICVKWCEHFQTK